MKNTPGPWKIEEYSEGTLEVHGVDGKCVCTLFGHYEDDSTVYPTARLIAAAPELLEACEDAIECLEEFLEDVTDDSGANVDNPLLVKLRAAVKKAEAS